RTIPNGHRFRCVDSVHSEYKLGPDYDYAFQEQHSSKECLLPRAGAWEDYDDANRYLYQRRMVQRVRRNRPSKQHSYESCLNRKMLPGGTRNGNNVRVAPNGREAQNWCHRRKLVSAQHLKAETAADPILILQGAISPQTVPAYRIADNRRSRQRYEVTGYRPSGVIDDSSEDTSPPFERKQLRFTSLPCTAYHHKPKKSYRDIVKESKLKACYNTQRGAIIMPPAISPRSPPSTSNIEDFNGPDVAYKADDDYVEVEERYDFENSRQRSGNCDHEKRTKCKMSSSKAVTRVHSGRTWPRKERVPAFPVRRVLAKERHVEPETWQITGDREMELRLQTAYPTSLWDAHQGRITADQWIPSNQKDRRFHGKAITEAESRGGDESVPPLRPKFRPWKKSVTRPAVPLWQEVTPDDRETQFYSCRDVLTPELGIGADSEPQTETWSPLSLLPPMPQKRVDERNEILRFIRSDWFYTEDMALIPKFQNLACPNLMLIGGISFQHPTEYLNGAAVLLYHPVKEAWFFYGSTPEPRCYHTAVLVGNTVIVSGGFDPLRVGTNGEMRPSSKVFLLDLAYRSWRTLANMRHDRAYHAAVGWHDRMVVFGGMDHTGRTLSSCEVYYRKPNQWAIIHPMPLPLMGMGATTLNGRIWVLGGLTRTRHGVSLRDSVYVFDPKTDSWQEEVPLLQPRAFCTAATVLWDVWVVGGILDLHSLQCTSRIDVLDVAGGLWERRADLPAPKHSVQIAKAGHLVYMIGGQASANKASNTMTAFDRRDRTFHSCLPLPKSIAGFTALGLPEDKKALHGRFWPGTNATPQTRWNAAITIQRAYRQYRREGHLQHCSAVISQISFRHKRKALAKTRNFFFSFSFFKQKWPPSTRSSTTVDSKLGDCITGEKRCLHYEPLPLDMDPNLGMLINMDNSFLKTKTLLGLRMTPENLSAGIRLLRLARQPCDPCLPVILLFGGLDPRNPLDTG
ncbi:unnamed protein product, partial [Ixodes pacificus]